jgi:hypothetical protein
MTRPRKYLGDIRIKPDAKAPVVAKVRPCAHPGCIEEGIHHVPRNRQNLEERIWLCRDHTRAHNEAWDFFAGMTEKEIERFRIEAITGHRPTWPLGKRAARMRNGVFEFDDAFGHFGDTAAPPPRPPVRRLTGVQQQALAVMNLAETATLQEIKARYKELVKRFHPDANGGDRGAEERLKQVIRAYGVLRRQG